MNSYLCDVSGLKTISSQDESTVPLGKPIPRYYSAWHSATLLFSVLRKGLWGTNRPRGRVPDFRPWEDSDLSEKRVVEPPKSSDRPEPLTVHKSRPLYDGKLWIQANPLHLPEHQPTGAAQVQMFVKLTLEAMNRTAAHLPPEGAAFAFAGLPVAEA